MQAKSWGAMRPGEWLLEKRVSKNGDSSYHLCFYARRGEQSLDAIPSDLVTCLINGGAVVVESRGFE